MSKIYKSASLTSDDLFASVSFGGGGGGGGGGGTGAIYNNGSHSLTPQNYKDPITNKMNGDNSSTHNSYLLAQEEKEPMSNIEQGAHVMNQLLEQARKHGNEFAGQCSGCHQGRFDWD